MVQFNTGIDRTFIAAEAITQYTIVAVDTSVQNQILEADTSTDKIIGVATGFGKDGSEGDAVQVQKGGFSTKIAMSASCNIGDLITATTNGFGVATTSNGDFIVGRALEAASEEGDVIEVELLMGYYYAS
jgi:Uncharacterized conserved protein (DUF2190)